MPKPRRVPAEIQLPRGRPPRKGTAKYAEYMKMKKQLASLREASDVTTMGGLPQVRRGKPPADPVERQIWQQNNDVARALRQATGISLVPGKTPRVLTAVPVVEESTETDAQILARHVESFRQLHDLTTSVALGDLRALIVSGGPGIGKTVTATEVLNHHKSKSGIRYKKLSGKITPIELFKHLYWYRGPKDVLLIDDADSLFFAEDSLNLLKAALDTLDTRIPTWRSNTSLLVDDNGSEIPREFTYEGSMIFVSNLNFDRITSGPASKIADHLKAVINRSIYFDLRMHTPRELFIWTKHVVQAKGILQQKRGLSSRQEEMALAWMDQNKDRMREVSIRSAMHIGLLIGKHTKNWEKMAARTQFRNTPSNNLVMSA